jgi:two-component system sensor histidine kinase TctE
VPSAPPLLRTQLLTWLLVPLLLLLAVDAVLTYWMAMGISQRANDRPLAEIAREMSLRLRASGEGLALDLAEDARKILLADPVDRIHFDVSAADGRAVAGERIRPAPAGPGAESYYDGELDGAPVRIVELRVVADAAHGRPAAFVRVAETLAKRQALAREILVGVLVPEALLVMVAGIVVWAGVVHGLSPLERLRRTVASRAYGDWRPVGVEGVPGEVRPLLESLNALVAQLDRALTIQNRFISDAAHQLKTPITVLRTQLELALREDDPARMRAALEKSSAGLDRLSRVVSQLLSLARNEPEAGASAVLVPLDLDALALEVATEWVPEAMKKRVDLGFEPAPGPVTIRGDAARLRELFDNLLDNAVRYSREGGRVTVRVGADPVPTVDINDDGPGIPPDERERVFQRFHRLLGSGQDGSGLGLAIAQEIARIHGGAISLRDDSDGIGNTFSVTFPPVA